MSRSRTDHLNPQNFAPAHCGVERCGIERLVSRALGGVEELARLVIVDGLDFVSRDFRRFGLLGESETFSEQQPPSSLVVRLQARHFQIRLPKRWTPTHRLSPLTRPH